MQSAFSIAYPVGDMVLVMGVASVVLRRTTLSSTVALRFMAASLLFVRCALRQAQLWWSNSFDGSIQGQIAKEASDRLVVAGFEPRKLAAALEASANHSD